MIPSDCALHALGSGREAVCLSDEDETDSGGSKQIDELVCLFRCLDIDGDGEISADDFANALVHMAPPVGWYGEEGDGLSKRDSNAGSKGAKPSAKASMKAAASVRKLTKGAKN